MTTISNVTMFYIGNFADMDTFEGDADNEYSNVVLGTHDNLVLTDIAEVDVNDDGIMHDNENGTGDYLSYDTGGGVTNVNLDSSSLYNADILLGDGSTMSVPVLVLQAANGDVFVSEYPPNSLDGLAIQSISLVSLDTSNAAGIYRGASDVENASVVCFSAGTLIDTPDGPRAVEALQPGEQVMTLDHGAQTVRWTRITNHQMDDEKDQSWPVQIKAGSLGHNRPAHDLIVSSQHRILIGRGQLDNVFDIEAFAPAKSLIVAPGIRHMKGIARITWVHFACDRHEVVNANGCLSETLLLGPMVMKGLSFAERQSLRELFGPAPAHCASLNGPPARECLTVRRAKHRIAQHLKVKKNALAKEMQKWDRDLAREDYQASRMRHAVPIARAC